MSPRRALAALLALALLAAFGVAAWRVLRRAADPRAPAAPGAARPAPSATLAPEPAAPPPAAPGAAPPAAPEPEAEAPLGLAGVDLEAVRAALPDNLYWETAAPTSDPAVLEARQHARDERNALYGKILSGTGSDEEILAYYDQRMRASSDYLAFVDYLLEHHGSELTDSDLGLLLVAKRLHQARLEEIPRRIQEARERKAQQDEARRAWREEQEAFEAEPDASP